MKTLYVGDPHVTADELDDCGALLQFVEDTAKHEQVGRIVFLGDLHNNFAVTNVRVTAFWYEWFKSLRDVADVVALVGNHDMLGNGQAWPHALTPYSELITVIEKPQMMGRTLFVPYLVDPNLFLKAVGQHKDARLIVCHQEFNGAQYDNGMFAPHGVDPSFINVPVIAGHIHTQQICGPVWYVGAPRWRTLSDAMESERFIRVIDDDGQQISAHPTSPVVKVIHDLRITPNTEHIVRLFRHKDEYRMHFEGPAEWIKDQLHKLKDQNIKNKRITTTATDSKVIHIKESDGVDNAFGKYIDSFKPKNGTTAEKLKELAAVRI